MNIKQPRITSLDEACAYLAAFAKAHGLANVEVTVWSDGRVAFTGTNPRHFHAWTVRADTTHGSDLQCPSAALADRLTDAGRAALAGMK